MLAFQLLMRVPLPPTSRTPFTWSALLTAVDEYEAWQAPQPCEVCSDIVWRPVGGGTPWHAVQAVIEALQDCVCVVPPELVPVLSFTAWHQVEAQLPAVVPLRGVYVPIAIDDGVAPVKPTSATPFACDVV